MNPVAEPCQPRTSSSLPAILSTVEGLIVERVEEDADGLRVRLSALPGIYQLSVWMDAAAFDWESLYYPMQEFGNNGVRTGPWDFRPVTGTPMLPSYWVSHNERRLGLWYPRRVTLEDLEHRMFSARLRFCVGDEGRQTLAFSQYSNGAALGFETWRNPVLEAAPLELERVGEWLSKASFAKLPTRQWSDPDFWATKRRDLADTSLSFRQPLEQVHEWFLEARGSNSEVDPDGRRVSMDSEGPKDVLAWLVLYRVFGEAIWKDAILSMCRDLIALPGWGRPAPDVYGWNGDLVAITSFRALIYAVEGLGGEMDPELKAAIFEKLRIQGRAFIDSLLLSVDYWGGSLLQDHGRMALAGFAHSALHLVPDLEEASQWFAIAFCLVGQALEASPRDGTIPASSYDNLNAYTTEIALLRDSWLAVSDRDIYADYSFPLNELGAYVVDSFDPLAPMRSGAGAIRFLGHVADASRDGKIAWIRNRFIGLTEEDLEGQWFSYRSQAYSLADGFIGQRCRMDLEPIFPAQQQLLRVFPDSGQILFRTATSRMDFRCQCGPWIGYKGWSLVDGPCDRMTVNVGPGHFHLSEGGCPVLTTPDSRYALRTNTRTSMLIDGKGQHGDIGYPMSISGWRYRGERIESHVIAPDGRTGWVRLNLAPLYPEPCELIRYTREFQFLESGVVIWDIVSSRIPHRWTWLFQGREQSGLKQMSGTHWKLSPAVDLELLDSSGVRDSSSELTALVNGYVVSPEAGTARAVRFDHLEPSSEAFAKFLISWQHNT